MTGPGYLNINDDPAALGTFFSDKKPNTAQPSTLSHTQQQGAQQTQQSISYDGADPTYITRMEQFEGITHEEIYRNAQAMSPGIMHQQADTWISIADTLSGGLLGAQLSIQKALTTGMEGKTADAALAAAQKFYQQASDVQEVISTCGHRIKAAAHAAEVVKASVPPTAASQSGTGSPSTMDPAQIIIAAVGAGLASSQDGDQVAYQRGVEALHRTAIDTMNNNYKPSYGPAGNGIPTFVPVQAPGGGPGGDSGGTGGTGGPRTGGTNNGGGTGNDGGQSTNEPSPSDPNATQTSGLDSNSTDAQQSSTNRTPETTTNPGATTSTSPASTSPASTTTSSGTRPVSPGSTTATPGGTSGPGSGSPGRSVSGLPVGASTAAAATSSASTSATTGRSGMPGMMSPGAGKKDDTESNRKTPDYLIGDHEEELLGPQNPQVPQVIGDDAPATRPDAPQRPHNQDQRR
ncbi:hypothetical protein ACQP1G_43885 [Nocardia sp. CA-107356]|uniref:hypothetical protein n=1 Tax=Nocardia sp. CA-107356 TaxID=3239972 RepID=UPI003D8BEE19